MLTQTQDDLLTRTGRGTPAGRLFRGYWLPVALAEDLPSEGSRLPLRILGEDLVLFKAGDGTLGLLGLHCSHRGADLSYGRVENEGLRCIYHGWLYDVAGRCVDQPGEPPGSQLKTRVKHLAYPCREQAGVILAYFGEGEPPAAPAYEFLTVPTDQVFATKILHSCNYLQTCENDVDLIHLTFLHHNRIWDSSVETPSSFESVTPEGPAPNSEIVETDVEADRLRVCKIRDLGSRKHLYLATFALPSLFAFGSQAAGYGYSVHWHVPIDDTHHWKFVFLFARDEPISRAVRDQLREQIGPDYVLRANAQNRYRQDLAAMETESYSGLGDGPLDYWGQDLCVLETTGVIADRVNEFLGSTDAGVVQLRRFLMSATQAAGDPKVNERDPSRIAQAGALSAWSGFVPAATDWRRLPCDP